MFREKSIEEYVKVASSDAPTPGGGSVSALVGALGASMASMAASFTVGREKFRSVEGEVRAALEAIGKDTQKLLALMEMDSEEYAKVTAAYKMPRKTDEEKILRTQKTQEALRSALTVPRDGIQACLDVARQSARLMDIANPMLLSDVGVAAVLAAAALEGCRLNVEVNLAAINDVDLKKQLVEEMNAGQQECEQLKAEVLRKLRARLSS